MNGSPPKPRFFWPVLFITAFGLGALLWGVWMFNIIQRTRHQQQDGFFVPQGNPPPAPLPAAAPQTNLVQPTNKP